MNSKKMHFVQQIGEKAGRLAVAALVTAFAAGALTGQNSVINVFGKKQTMTTKNKFYCNIKALTPTERAHHTELTAKLMATRREIVESAKGYEFQFRRSDVSLAELADWAVAEAKCCPFFDFHLDLENEGKLLCLRLTGEEGIKAFIRTEFQVEDEK
jgi:hypothetical protein